MFEIFQQVASAPDVAGGDLKTIVITSLSAVAAASLPAVIALREKKSDKATPDKLATLDEKYHQELQDQINAANDSLKIANASCTETVKTIAELREFIGSLGYDPYRLTPYKKNEAHNE